MATLRAARETLRTLRRTPRLFLAGVAMAVLLAPQYGMGLLIPVVPRLVGILSFFVAVFVYAALFGAAARALTGPVTLETATDIGRETYLPLLGGKLIAAIAQLVWMGAVAGSVVVTLVVASGSRSAGALLGSGDLIETVLGTVPGQIGAVVTASLLVAGAVAWFALQFYDVAIVLGDGRIDEGFHRSVEVARRRPLAVAGYTAITLGVYTVSMVLPWVIATLVAFGVPALNRAIAPELTLLIGPLVFAMALTVAPLVGTVVIVPVLGTYKVAFFERVTDGETRATSPRSDRSIDS